VRGKHVVAETAEMFGNSPTRADSAAIATHRARKVNAHRAIVTASLVSDFLSHRISLEDTRMAAAAARRAAAAIASFA
jgi:hypothetical protein